MHVEGTKMIMHILDTIGIVHYTCRLMRCILQLDHSCRSAMITSYNYVYIPHQIFLKTVYHEDSQGPSILLAAEYCLNPGENSFAGRCLQLDQNQLL